MYICPVRFLTSNGTMEQCFHERVPLAVLAGSHMSTQLMWFTFLQTARDGYANV